jgi:hypothetical protein
MFVGKVGAYPRVEDLKVASSGRLRPGGAATHQSGNSSKRQLIEAATHRIYIGAATHRMHLRGGNSLNILHHI